MVVFCVFGCAVVTSLAGGSTNLVGDATGTNARFDRPLSVAMDLSNNIIVADQGTERVRQVTALGGTTEFVAHSLSSMECSGALPSDATVGSWLRTARLLQHSMWSELSGIGCCHCCQMACMSVPLAHGT